MIVKNITSLDLFRNLVEITINDFLIDLHNDYYCDKIKFVGNTNELILGFSSVIKSKKPRLVTLKFKQVVFENIHFKFEGSSKKVSLTIDTLYRGRFENGGILKEFSDDGKSYFYLDFYEPYSLEFFSTDLIVEF